MGRPRLMDEAKLATSLEAFKLRRNKPKTTATLPHDWKAGECSALASKRCTNCHARGVIMYQCGPNLTQSRAHVCRCVLREVFKICYRRWLDTENVPTNRFSVIEFRSDFERVAKKAVEPLGWPHPEILRLYFFGRMRRQEAATKLGIDRVNFFHAVYRLQKVAGKALRKAGVFPIDEYLSPPNTDGRRGKAQDSPLPRPAGTLIRRASA